MTRYVCAEHPDEATDRRGRGCRRCATSTRTVRQLDADDVTERLRRHADRSNVAGNAR